MWKDAKIILVRIDHFVLCVLYQCSFLGSQKIGERTTPYVFEGMHRLGGLFEHGAPADRTDRNLASYVTHIAGCDLLNRKMLNKHVSQTGMLQGNAA